MAKTFAYKAKNCKGELLVGNILAEDENAVAVHIQGKGYFITQIKEENTNPPIIEFINQFRKIGVRDTAIFCRLFSTMIDAGLPLLSCFAVLIEQSDNLRMKKALQDVYKKIKEGDSLSRCLSSHPKIFPILMINLIEAGEVGGVLDDILRRLAEHFEKEHKMNEKIKTALTYPAVIGAMSIFSMIFTLIFVLPSFVQIFETMKVELPLLTQLLLGFSKLLQNNLLCILISLIIGGYSLQVTYRKGHCKRIIDSFIMRFSVVNTLSRKVGIARFCRTLSILLHSGVPIITALEVVIKTVHNRSIAEAMEEAQLDIKEGINLRTALTRSKVFTPMVIQMVSIGEESGSLDKMLGKIADFYESDVDDLATRLSSMIEPILIGMLGIFIGIVIVGIMTPLFDVITNIGTL